MDGEKCLAGVPPVVAISGFPGIKRLALAQRNRRFSPKGRLRVGLKQQNIGLDYIALMSQRCTEKCLARVKRVVATSPDRRSRAVRHRGRYANGERFPTEATAIYACGTPFGYRSGTGGSPRRVRVLYLVCIVGCYFPSLLIFWRTGLIYQPTLQIYLTGGIAHKSHLNLSSRKYLCLFFYFILSD